MRSATYGIQELRHLNFETRLPCPRLRPWVQCFWSVGREGGVPAELSEKLYPDGALCLEFDFAAQGGPTLQLRSAHARQSITFARGAGIDRLGLRFHPGAIHAFLRLPIGDALAPLQPLDPRDVPELLHLPERLSDLPGTTARIEALEAWLLRLAAHKQPRCGPLQKLLPQLPAAKDMTSLLDGSGLGRRKFERLFRDHVGTSPGRLRALLRVKQARYLLKRDQPRSLTELALSLGYFDQSHFIRQFKEITDEAPGDYRRRQRQRQADGQMLIL